VRRAGQHDARGQHVAGPGHHPLLRPLAPDRSLLHAPERVGDQALGRLDLAGFPPRLAGRTQLGGTRADYTVTPDENGQYESDLPDGVYKVWATVDVDYNGRHFRLPLASEDKKDMHAAYNSSKGIVKNFVWKLTGLLPGARPREYGSHWGVGVLLFDAGPTFEPDKHLKSKYPGSSVVVHLEPVGPLVDGSQGKALDLETPCEALYINDKRCKHLDVPLGDYKATAKLKLRDGRTRPLMIEVGPRVEVSQRGIPASREVKLEYAKGENGGIPAFNLSLSE
jgi:hypothetical protein